MHDSAAFGDSVASAEAVGDGVVVGDGVSGPTVATTGAEDAGVDELLTKSVGAGVLETAVVLPAIPGHAGFSHTNCLFTCGMARANRARVAEVQGLGARGSFVWKVTAEHGLHPSESKSNH